MQSSERIRRFGRRAAAATIDLLILALPFLALLAVFAFVIESPERIAGVLAKSEQNLTYAEQQTEKRMLIVDAIGVGGYIIAWFVYHAMLLSRTGEHNGQTLGKQLLRIRVVRDDGRALSPGYALKREALAKGVFWFAPALLLVVGVLISLADICAPLFDPRGRALHDRVAHSTIEAA